MTLQQKLESLVSAYTAITPKVYHYLRPKLVPPFIVWQEDGENGFDAGNIKAEQAITGSTDYFTQQESDPIIDQIQTAHNNLGIPWALNSVQYEDETNLIHYEWRWEVF